MGRSIRGFHLRLSEQILFGLSFHLVFSIGLHGCSLGAFDVHGLQTHNRKLKGNKNM